MKHLSLLVIFFCSLSAHAANGWIGSGGDLIQDTKNPWWLKNTKTIHYCIDFDSHSVSTTEQKAEEITEKVFSNWLKEWQYFFKSQKKEILMGSQVLIKTDCDGSEDIAFKFGWDSLNADQKEFIQRSRAKERLVGLAVRTEYDRRNLRGKGFIYIASDLGEHKFDLGKEYYRTPWRHDFLLTTILSHEIAHLFGLQHSDQFGGLMKEGVFDLILQKWYIKYLEPLLDMQPVFEFFSREKRFSTPADNGDSSILQFFNVDPASEITVSMESVTGIYLIHEKTNTGLNRLLARFYKKESRTDFGLNNSTVTVYLPEEQVVYPKDFSEIDRDYIFTNPVENFSGKLIDARTGSEKDVMFVGDRETLTLHHLSNGVKTTIEFSSTIYAPESDINSTKRRFDKKMTN